MRGTARLSRRLTSSVACDQADRSRSQSSFANNDRQIAITAVDVLFPLNVDAIRRIYALLNPILSHWVTQIDRSS